MTSLVRRRKISEIREEFLFFSQESIIDQLMTFRQPLPAPPNKVSPEQCKHPRVQIVSRDEDSEYVECQECGDVFESSELKDMAIEEKKEPEEE